MKIMYLLLTMTMWLYYTKHDYQKQLIVNNDNNEELINLQMIPTEENIENIRNENNVPAPDDDDVVVLHET